MSDKSQGFVHLHVHTEYSLLDGACRIKGLVERVKALGMNSVAITDHGVMYGVVDFYKECIKNDIKPIIGCEVYTARRTRFDRNASMDSDQGHLVLLAKNNEGYKNIMKLVSLGFTEGFYYKPRVDMELLRKYSSGLIALTACLSGDIPRHLLQNDYEEAKKTLYSYLDIFGEENVFLELQHNGLEEQNLVNQKLIKLSNETGVPLAATNDAHYLKREDARAHEILLCIQTAKNIDDEDRMKFPAEEFYIKSPDEMWSAFKNHPQCLENTIKIADICDVRLEFGKLHLPEYKVPEGYEAYQYLRELCFKGLENRYGGNRYGEHPGKHSCGHSGEYSCEYLEGRSGELRDKLEYELNVIKQMGYVDYFLIVWDFIKYARDNGIMVGPGRGSAAGSLVAYCLGITNIDPVRFNLLFERFLNPERVSMPDIDIDFCYERRQEVIDYVVRKYGEDRVAQIITFGTMAARAVIRDVGRALNISYGEVDVVAKQVPFQIGMNINKALEINPELRRMYDEDEKVKLLIDTARTLEGMPRHASTHAAGVVISKEPIMEYVPLQKTEESITTQFTMGLLEELGLLKMDFLGLRTLTVIRDTVNLIEKNHGRMIDMDALDMDDANAFKMIGEGRTEGVFQLESEGMKQFMKDLQPGSLEDIIAGISLYRPGPMDQIPRYIRNKNNPSEVKYAHPLLESILNVTYGCMVYQEQVMQVFRELAGYSLGRADLVRRAMSKKKFSVMQQEQEYFINGMDGENGNIVIKGCIRNEVGREIAAQIFDEMIDFANYAFNKSHAAAYAVVAYQTAWLKYYYPCEFMAALLNSVMGSSEKVSQYIYECRRMGIDVLPPDINESFNMFTVVRPDVNTGGSGKIRFGLSAVKNVGIGVVKGIIEERLIKGPFRSLHDFCERMDGRDINKRCIESLIKCGAFDTHGVYRSRMMAVYEKMLDGIQQSRKNNLVGQLSIFEIAPAAKQNGENIIYPEIREYPPKVLLSMEKEMLGIYLTGHPLNEFQDEIQQTVNFFSTQLNSQQDSGINETGPNNGKNLYDGMQVVVGGIIVSKKTKTTKSNNLMAFVNLEDLYGTMEIIVFPAVLERFLRFFEEESVVLISGRLSIKEEEQPKIICEDVKPLVKTQTRKMYIRVKKDDAEKLMDEIRPVCRFFNGNIPIYVVVEGEVSSKPAGRDFCININECIISELKHLLGEENVKMV